MKFYELLDEYDKLHSGHSNIDDLRSKRNMFEDFANYMIETKDSNYTDLLEKVLYMMNDYYVYSSEGDVLVTDRKYDELTLVYKRLTGESQIKYTDTTPAKSWNVLPHFSPNMVGSVEKVFTVDEVYDFLRKVGDELDEHDYRNARVIFAPKFDGASICITYAGSKIVRALTRKDGRNGLDETDLILSMRPEILEKMEKLVDKHRKSKKYKYCDVKCEIVMSQKSFDLLTNEKSYSNRRAAASAISSNPSNIGYARYLDLVPLAFQYRTDNHESYVHYEPEILYKMDKDLRSRWDIDLTSVKLEDVYHYIDIVDRNINDVLYEINDPRFPYRTDGVVIFVISKGLKYDRDAMENSIAFKTNKTTAVTTVVEGYFSIGRFGNATPMLKVEPADVNETVVTDVSLSNMKKFNSFKFREGDSVLIKSSGDVIPMIVDVVKRNRYGKLIELDPVCPFCGNLMVEIESADRSSYDYKCVYDDCVRIKAGRISNFIDKMGGANISDQLVMNILMLDIAPIRSRMEISDFFTAFTNEKNLKTLSAINGWGSKSTEALRVELQRLMNQPTLASRFLGSFGIPDIGVRKCKVLMKYYNLQELLDDCKKDKRKAEDDIISIDGFSLKSANRIIEFVKLYYTEINRCIDLFNVQDDPAVVDATQNVVFTGFRDKDIEREINDMGIGVSESINGDTIAVVASKKDTGKVKKAEKKNIPIFMAYELDELFEFLMHIQVGI